jgi:predicted nucleic acid-binding protein
LEELGRVLKDKFKIDVHTVANTIELVKSVAEVVEVESRVRVILHPDGDNRVLECAGDGKADLIVTGDTKHILPLGKYKGTRILSPAEFVRFIPLSLP